MGHGAEPGGLGWHRARASHPASVLSSVSTIRNQRYHIHANLSFAVLVAQVLLLISFHLEPGTVSGRRSLFLRCPSPASSDVTGWHLLLLAFSTQISDPISPDNQGCGFSGEAETVTRTSWFLCCTPASGKAAAAATHSHCLASATRKARCQGLASAKPSHPLSTCHPPSLQIKELGHRAYRPWPS